MQDVAPELLEKIKAAFEKETKELKKTIENGVRSYEEAYGHAITAGEALAKSFRNNITAEALPDGKMYYNIADRVVRPMLKEEYNLVSEAAVLAQASANKSAKIGLNPQKADFDEDRAYGIVNRVSSQPYDEIKWILDEPVKSFSKSVVDQTIQTNIDFQGKSGLSPKIVRTPTAGACAWCLAVAGTYSYPNVPRDVYRRHANCDCIVEYVNAGKIQNVHTKKVRNSEERAKIEYRKGFNKTNSQKKYDIQFFSKKTKHASKRAIERNISDEEIEDALENPLNGEGGEFVIGENGDESIKYIGRKATVCISTDESDDISYTVWKTSKATRKYYEKK